MWIYSEYINLGVLYVMNSMQRKMDKICKSIENKSKIEYSKLKEILELEDYFFDVIVKKTAEDNNIKIKFIGKYICFERSDNNVGHNNNNTANICNS